MRAGDMVLQGNGSPYGDGDEWYIVESVDDEDDPNSCSAHVFKYIYGEGFREYWAVYENHETVIERPGE